MTPDEPSPDSLDGVIAEYLRLVDAGATPDREAFLAEHAKYAEGLRSFFGDQDRFEPMAVPFRPLDPEATLAPDTVASGPPSNVIRYFGDYELLDEIARGGMGVVYKARQVSLNRIVALKMILTGQLASPADVQRFRSEAEAAANLDHPNIVPIYEVGEHEGQQYFSMKFIEGKSLSVKIKSSITGDTGKKRLFLASPMLPMVKILSSVARAVHHAHQRGILHRDLKPGNILLDRDGMPYVTDFGLAKRVEGDSNLTQSGAILGTPAYMSPEQARAEKTISTSADVYSLGAILYECLTGRPPFHAETPLDTLLRVLEREPDRPTECDRDLATVALKCLEKEPAKRYDSAAALADELDRWSRGEPILARPAGLVERAWRWCRRNQITAALLGGVAAALVLGTVVSTEFALTALSNARIAQSQERTARRLLYGSRMNQIQMAWEANNVGRIHELLEATIPKPGEDDLRGFEWYYWNHLCHGQHVSLSAGAEIASVRFSTDGKHIIAPVLDSTLRVWDAKTGASIDSIHLLDLPHRWDAFSPDGRFWEMRNHDNLVQMTDSSKTMAAIDLEGLKGNTDFSVFSPDGRRLAGVHGEGDIDIWDTRTGKKLKTIADLRASRLAFSPDGRYLACTSKFVGSDQAVTLWDLQDSRVVWRQSKLESALFSFTEVSALAFGPTGRYLATGAGSGTLRVFDAATGSPFREFLGHKGAVTDLAFSPDGERLASVGDDRTLRVWNTGLSDDQIMLRGHSDALTSVAFSPDGQSIATAGRDGVVQIWNALADQGPATKEIADLATELPADFVAVVNTAERIQSADGSKFIVREDWDGTTLRVVDAATMDVIRSFSGEFGTYFDTACFSPDGSLVAANPASGLKIWELATGREVFEGQWSMALSFSPNARWIAGATFEITPEVKLIPTGIVIWDLTNRHKLCACDVRNEQIYGLAFSPNQSRLASISAGGIARIWDVVTGQELLTLDPPADHHGFGISFTNDGRRLVTTSDGTEIRVYSTSR